MAISKNWKQLSILIILFLFAGIGCQSSQSGSKSDSDYVKQIKEWHQKRIDRLKQPTGWLSLVGLYWLHPGENSFGADSSDDIVFPPEKVPARMGTFILKDSTVTVQINPGVEVLHDEQPVSKMELKSDNEGKPTDLSYGSLVWYAIKRGDQFGIRLKDKSSPLIQKFRGIDTYPIDKKWRVVAKFEPYNPPKMIDVPTILGTVSKSASPGALVFELEGKTYRLDPLADSPEEEFFVIFADETNGHETYGGGRFIYTDPPDKDGKVILDFNKAYNPPCVFTEYATCPLPPEQNNLPFKVTAGEKAYGHAVHSD